MERFGESFDHNLHALRIVESFEQRYARFPGLNLTFEVREGIVKHSRDFGPGVARERTRPSPDLCIFRERRYDRTGDLASEGGEARRNFSRPGGSFVCCPATNPCE